MYIVKCDTCASKYRITDISQLGNIDTQYYCKYCGRSFSIAKQLTHLENDSQPLNNTNLKKIINTNQTISGNHPNGKQFFNSNGRHIGFWTRRFKKFTLRKKFNIALVSMMLLSMLTTYCLSEIILNKGAEKQVLNNARFLLTMIEASRSFTSTVLKPVLYKELPGRFIVEGMSSSFCARNIFDRIKDNYPNYYFKHAAPNPRNKLNLADEVELDIIRNTFNLNPQVKEWQGYRDINGRKDFIFMKPIVAEERCMKCHSKPENAPKEIIERYGDKAAFGMKTGDVIGALSVSVPATEILNKARHSTIVVNSIVLSSFILLILIINVFFQKIVVKPLQKLSQVIEDISVGRTNTSITASGSDEINDLARGFERMRMSINLAMLKRKLT